MKQSRCKVLGDLHEMINSCTEGAQARFLFLHVRKVSQVGFSDLRTRLLLVIGQNVSGLIHQPIGAFERRPQRRRARERPGEELLQVL
jgi:hypothetical protein